MVPQYVDQDKVWDVRYLTNQERLDCKVRVSDGAMLDNKGEKLHPGRHIFVIDENNRIFTSPVQIVGQIHHSSFLGGAPVQFAGEMFVNEEGKPDKITTQTGHYRTSDDKLDVAKEVFTNKKIDISKTQFQGFS